MIGPRPGRAKTLSAPVGRGRVTYTARVSSISPGPRDEDSTATGTRPTPARLSLAYAPRVPLANRFPTLALREGAGVALAAGGFLFARGYGNSGNLFGNIGAAVIVVGTRWYVVARIQRRTWMSGRCRAQLVLASFVCIAGVLAVWQEASHAREGPGPATLRYWMYSNQTYRYRPERALRFGRITVAGLVWFAAVVAFDRLSHWRRTASLARTGAARNNRPSEQE